MVTANNAMDAANAKQTTANTDAAHKASTHPAALTPAAALEHSATKEADVTTAEGLQTAATNAYAAAITTAKVDAAVQLMVDANKAMVEANKKQVLANNAAYKASTTLAGKTAATAAISPATEVAEVTAAKLLQTDATTAYGIALTKTDVDAALKLMTDANVAMVEANKKQVLANDAAYKTANTLAQLTPATAPSATSTEVAEVTAAKLLQTAATTAYGIALTKTDVDAAIQLMVDANKAMVLANAVQVTANTPAALTGDAYRAVHAIATPTLVTAPTALSATVQAITDAKKLQTDATTAYTTAVSGADIDAAIQLMVDANTAMGAANLLQDAANLIGDAKTAAIVFVNAVSIPTKEPLVHIDGLFPAIDTAVQKAISDIKGAATVAAVTAIATSSAAGTGIAEIEVAKKAYTDSVSLVGPAVITAKTFTTAIVTPALDLLLHSQATFDAIATAVTDAGLALDGVTSVAAAEGLASATGGTEITKIENAIAAYKASTGVTQAAADAKGFITTLVGTGPKVVDLFLHSQATFDHIATSETNANNSIDSLVAGTITATTAHEILAIATSTSVGIGIGRILSSLHAYDISHGTF